MYICLCAAVTDRQIRAKVAEGAETLDDLRSELGVAMCCGSCSCAAEDLIAETRELIGEGALSITGQSGGCVVVREAARSGVRPLARGTRGLDRLEMAQRQPDSIDLGSGQLEMA
jgi:bacterioferritin-associated ferredoxin